MKIFLCKTAVAIVCLAGLAACGGSPKKEAVTAAIKKIMPVNFEVVAISNVTGIDGLFEVQIKADKQTLVLYVNKAANLVVSGSIVDVNSKQNLTVEAQKKMAVK